MPYEITQCYLPPGTPAGPAEVTFPPLHQPKLVLDLATPEGCKLSWPGWWLYPKIDYSRNTVTYLRN